MPSAVASKTLVETTWRELVEVARWTPSPHNMQPWVDAPADFESLRVRVLALLAELNQDYREAARFMPPESVPA